MNKGNGKGSMMQQQLMLATDQGSTFSVGHGYNGPDWGFQVWATDVFESWTDGATSDVEMLEAEHPPRTAARASDDVPMG